MVSMSRDEAYKKTVVKYFGMAVQGAIISVRDLPIITKTNHLAHRDFKTYKSIAVTPV